jgi:hypothetical protein
MVDHATYQLMFVNPQRDATFALTLNLDEAILSMNNRDEC